MASSTKRMGFILKPGFAPNPLLKYPVNSVCVCGSGKKFKKCCGPKMPNALPDTVSNKMKGKSYGAQMSVLLEFLNAEYEIRKAKGEFKTEEPIHA